MQLLCDPRLGKYLSKDKTDILLNQIFNKGKTESFLKVFRIRVLCSLGLCKITDIQTINNTLACVTMFEDKPRYIKLSEIFTCTLDMSSSDVNERHDTFFTGLYTPVVLETMLEFRGEKSLSILSDPCYYDDYDNQTMEHSECYGIGFIHKCERVRRSRENSYTFFTGHLNTNMYATTVLTGETATEIKQFVNGELVLLGYHVMPTPEAHAFAFGKSAVYVLDEIHDINIFCLPNNLILNEINTEAVNALRKDFNEIKKLDKAIDLVESEELREQIRNKIKEIHTNEYIFDNLTFVTMAKPEFRRTEDLFSETIVNGVLSQKEILEQYGKCNIVGYYKQN